MRALDYDLPAAAIAQTPLEPRDAARLLVDNGPALPPEHRTVAGLPDLLAPGDVLVLNATRVLPARLRLHKPTGGEVEVLLIEPNGDGWHALVRPGRRVPVGTVLLAGDEPAVEVGPATDDGRRRVRLLSDDLAGEMPLPPYIHEPLADPERYQTVYAEHPGSVAAPTAGLHLTDGVLDRCRQRGVRIETVDLTIGLDTFRPLTEDHVLHGERYEVAPSVLEACAAADRVVAVGTSTVRALESAAAGQLSGRTRLFIHGDYEFRVVDLLLTNFHLPRSSLLLLVDAFVGPRWRNLYSCALREGYRFLSFGDAMLLCR